MAESAPVEIDPSPASDLDDARRALKAAVAAHAMATATMEQAVRARKVAIWRMSRAGATQRAIAAELGISQPVVLQLIRRGERINEAPLPLGLTADGVCLRDGCPWPAQPGGRFCASHQYG